MQTPWDRLAEECRHFCIQGEGWRNDKHAGGTSISLEHSQSAGEFGAILTNLPATGHISYRKKTMYRTCFQNNSQSFGQAVRTCPIHGTGWRSISQSSGKASGISAVRQGHSWRIISHTIQERLAECKPNYGTDWRNKARLRDRLAECKPNYGTDWRNKAQLRDRQAE